MLKCNTVAESCVDRAAGRTPPRARIASSAAIEHHARFVSVIVRCLPVSSVDAARAACRVRYGIPHRRARARGLWPSLFEADDLLEALPQMAGAHAMRAFERRDECIRIPRAKHA